MGLQNGRTPHCAFQNLSAVFHVDKQVQPGVFYDDDDAVLYGRFFSPFLKFLWKLQNWATCLSGHSLEMAGFFVRESCFPHRKLEALGSGQRSGGRREACFPWISPWNPTGWL